MKFLDLFAGIGGFRLGMESAGHECIGFCEIDKFARTSYKAIHDTTGEVEMHDITTISDEFIWGIGSVDVICGGFPCQAFSIAGKRKGFEDTRGTLFFEIARFASILRPRYLFLENVKGLLNHEGGATFETILRALDELGYDVEWQVFNSKDYIPQNRERVFIIGHLRGERTRKVFPFKKNDRTFTLTAQDRHGVLQVGNTVKTDSFGGNPQRGRVYNPNGISPCLNCMQGGGLEPKILIDNYQIRKLTPRECWRLQGFPDWAFDKAKEVNSDSQLYKQAGNSVTVPVIADIVSRLESE
ncbi:DNA cytosine methyltransferase [Enterococcus sp. C47]|nr:DNA cytosine methyltransferase [Enterococcus faecalis]MBD9857764.1 DNA cytosine methyltransferase [Enterococcus faecalis]MDB1649538.1 DNA cytosine methyltransferase [Enterococcus faecalis]MDB1659794.1 DNA cytosine methyltransferase [Enterococcus faecalis]